MASSGKINNVSYLKSTFSAILFYENKWQK